MKLLSNFEMFRLSAHIFYLYVKYEVLTNYKYCFRFKHRRTVIYHST